MNNIIIIGAGALGREVQWLIERINNAANQPIWRVSGYIDDGIENGKEINGVPVLGGIRYLYGIESTVNVVCAIADTSIRKKIIAEVIQNDNIVFPNLIDPNIVSAPSVKMGIGNIICASNVLSIDILLADFVIIDWSCTIGHDVKIDSFVTVYPGVSISGCVNIGEQCQFGTGTRVIQGIKINENVITGAGAVVTKDIEKSGTYVGVPAKITNKG